MKKALLLTLAIVMVLSLAACSSSAPKQLIIATGGTSGTYYPLGGGLAQIITDDLDINTTAQSTGASVENVRLLEKGDVDLAFIQNDVASYAQEGINMFDKPVESVVGVATLYFETIQLVVPAGSDINSIEDLKGKDVSVGAPGSGTEANVNQILSVYNMTIDDLKAEHLSFGDSTQKIQDGNLDAAFVTAGAPTSAVTQLSATKGVKIIPIEADKIQALTEKYPFLVEQTLEAGIYPDVPETKTVAVKAMLVSRKDLSEDTVYKMTKAIFDNTDKLAIINAKAKQISAKSAVEGMSIDFHPGALKYYKEQGLK